VYHSLRLKGTSAAQAIALTAINTPSAIDHTRHTALLVKLAQLVFVSEPATAVPCSPTGSAHLADRESAGSPARPTRSELIQYIEESRS
jgi:hypothetical protein